MLYSNVAVTHKKKNLSDFNKGPNCYGQKTWEENLKNDLEFGLLTFNYDEYLSAVIQRGKKNHQLLTRHVVTKTYQYKM